MDDRTEQRGPPVEVEGGARDQLDALPAAEAALGTSDVWMRTAMHQAPIGMALLAMDGILLSANEAFGTLVDVQPDSLRGTSYHELLVRGTIDLPAPLIGADASAAAMPTVAEARFRHEDGTEVDLDVHIALVRGPDQEPVGAIVQVVDTTVAHRTTAELQRANEELQRFASVASHDLRSPLATARGLLELLGTRISLSDVEGARALADRAGRQLARLSETVDGLLALASYGAAPLRHRDVSAAALLAEVIDALADPTAHGGSTIELETDATLTGDERLLRSLLQNLVTNGLRSAGGGRPVRVRVTAARDERSWRLAVTDDGDGFPAYSRDHLFEPFTHADRAGQEPGHGLGLAICARIVERHGGSIEVDHLDPGTRIRVEVPLTPAEVVVTA